MMTTEPHAMHRWLHQLLGDWTSEAGGDPQPGDEQAEHGLGAEHGRALGDLWVILEGTGTLPDGGEAQMRMTLGYDPEQNVFLGTWVGSMMTHMWIYRGTLDADHKTLTLETEGPSFQGDGKTSRYRDVITMVSPTERTLTSFSQQPDGGWKQFMLARYRKTA